MEMIKACLYIVLLLFIPTYIVADDRDGCPTNLSRDQYLKVHGGKCYEFVVHRHLSWPKAESDCRTRGGHLVKVDDLAEEEYIMGNLRSYNFRGQGVWIGLTRPRDGASFTWVTGEPMQFQYWAPGQPGSGSGRRRRLLLDTIQQLIPTSLPSIHLPKLIHEDCVLLKYSDSGLWHDYPCEKLDLLGLVPENFPYVCEYPHSSINTNPPKPNIAMQITTARTTSAPGTDFPVTTTTSAPGTDFPITTTSSALGTDFPPSTQAPITTTGATTAATSKTTASPTSVVVIG